MHAVYVYIIHFESKLEHAQHYSGSSRNLKQRLIAHAHGRSSRLMKVIKEKGIQWVVGSVYQSSLVSARALERELKTQHNSKRYCGICSPIPKKLPMSNWFPLGSLPFPIASEDLKKLTYEEPDIQTDFTSVLTSPALVDQIVPMMKSEGKCLGYIPCDPDSGSGINALIDSGKIVTASIGDKLIGYLAFTKNKKAITIQQTIVSDDFRLRGIGKKMVNMVQEKFQADVQCKVREDLPANDFWTSIGFDQYNEIKHKSSGSTLNCFHRSFATFSKE